MDLFVFITRLSLQEYLTVLVAEVQTPVVQVIQPQANLPQGYTNQAIPNVPNPTSSIGI